MHEANITIEGVDIASRLRHRHLQWLEAGTYCRPQPSRIGHSSSYGQIFRLSLAWYYLMSSCAHGFERRLL